jgi:hypothetical protein
MMCEVHRAKKEEGGLHSSNLGVSVNNSPPCACLSDSAVTINNKLAATPMTMMHVYANIVPES